MSKKCRKVGILDLCDVERTRKGIIYPEETVYLQVSATHGAIGITESDTELEAGKYVIFKPKVKINPYYLQAILEKEMPRFMRKYMTGINIQVDMLKYLIVNYHDDINTRNEIGINLKKLDMASKATLKALEQEKELKRIMLSKMMP